MIISRAMSQADSVAVDSVIRHTPEADTLGNSDLQEESFQAYLDTLYQDIYSNIDTFGWDNVRINSGRFDSKNMIDTVRIVLCDSINGLHFVFPHKNYVSFKFGPSLRIWHYGVDIKVFTGDSIFAATDGIVRLTKYDRHGFGRVVVIRHPQGLETIYGHLSKVLVEANQKVYAGNLIGLGGNSGRSTGSHLHFETRYHGEPFDPNCFIDFSSFELKVDTLTITSANFEYLIELRKAKYHTIKSGDTLSGIAARYHTSVSKLCRLNNISSKTILRIGRKIRYQ
jgi:murein DD-endopeptidase MepM/ murein hydrolase activator NlpD